MLQCFLIDGLPFVNNILSHPFFAMEYPTTELHKIVYSVVVVVFFTLLIISCVTLPFARDWIYDRLYFLEPIQTNEPTPVVVPNVTYTMPCTTSTEPSTVFDYGTITTTDEDNRYICTTITDLPHVARVITGTESRTVYVYNVITGKFEVMKEHELYKTKKI